jgi:hypothetical protein
LGAVGGVVDVGALGSADDQHVDVAGWLAGGAAVALGPGAEDEDPFDPADVELLPDHGSRSETHSEEFRQRRGCRVVWVGAHHA